MFYAHRCEDGRNQTVGEHLEGVARCCTEFASKFSEAERGRLLGLAHDIGKCSDEFQRRLEGGPRVDHATAGALECLRRDEPFLAGCVAGHHSGLPDFGNPRGDMAGTPTLAGRLKKGLAGMIPPYDWKGKLPETGPMPSFQDPYTYSLWIRMLYSCLVDADYLDTEAFITAGLAERGGYDALSVLQERLTEYTEPWFPAKTELNEYRCDILEQCMDAALWPRGAYSLTVPTGGGKTVASLAFAVKHALEHGLDRVIYVIPYTSIIEQNAEVFRAILGGRNVVEHHNGVHLDEEDGTSLLNQNQRLATENWDAPLIVTTAVQFFESLYSNRPSKCRKLHNISNSVVIFDEAQMLPACHLKPCVAAIANLVEHFHTTVVLCTATQPALGDLMASFGCGLEVKEICLEAKKMYEKFRRVTYRDGGTLTNEQLVHELGRVDQVLCIVNTRKTARRVFDLLPAEGKFHLSTLMYPAHRKRVLDEVRQRLLDGLPCRVVSTSLIEAGVDIDFPAVYREMAGLDSIAQAAGRCNREGKRSAEDSIVTYFEGETPAPILQRTNIGAAREALSCGRDPGDPETIERYFEAWRSLIGDNLDKSNAVEHLRNGISGCALPFATVAENFHFIDNATCTVYIPLEEGAPLCQKLVDGSARKEDYRRLGQYGVSVYEQHYRTLLEADDIQPVSQDCAVLTNTQLYDQLAGLSLQADSGRAEFI